MKFTVSISPRFVNRSSGKAGSASKHGHIRRNEGLVQAHKGLMNLGLGSIYYGATSLKEMERTVECGQPLSFAGICLGLLLVLLYRIVIFGIVLFLYR